jgi:hypothetical protein
MFATLPNDMERYNAQIASSFNDVLRSTKSLMFLRSQCTSLSTADAEAQKVESSTAGGASFGGRNLRGFRPAWAKDGGTFGTPKGADAGDAVDFGELSLSGPGGPAVMPPTSLAAPGSVRDASPLPDAAVSHPGVLCPGALCVSVDSPILECQLKVSAKSVNSTPRPSTPHRAKRTHHGMLPFGCVPPWRWAIHGLGGGRSMSCLPSMVWVVGR